MVQGEAPCLKTPPNKEATPSTEEPKEQAEEETHDRRAEAGRQAEHTNRDYLDIETF